MTEFEFEGPLPPLEEPKKRGLMTDRMLAALGITLAGAAAFFPWYVFFNEDKFGIHVAAIDHTRDLPPMAPRNVMSVSPLAMINKNRDQLKPPPVLPLDALTTATVSKLGAEREADPAAKEQPFPAAGGFRLLHVANGRALIEDSAGMYMVRVGSILPDQSKLATLEQRDGQWVIITSKGEVVGTR